jgi:hypothetical protein
MHFVQITDKKKDRHEKKLVKRAVEIDSEDTALRYYPDIRMVQKMC